MNRSFTRLRYMVFLLLMPALIFTPVVGGTSHAFSLDVDKRVAPNGLPVLQVERHNIPVVMVTLLVKASPLSEPADKAGVAYLTSKMLTEGTAKRSAAKISEDIEFLGASLDASTTHDFTTISLSVLKKDVDKGFELFSDILLNPVFREDELNRKKALITGALRQREEDPAFVAGRAFIKEVFGTHAYGRLVEGSIESVGRIQRDDVLDFYRANYCPDNAILSVVGDLTPQELNALVGKYLAGPSGWKRTCPAPQKVSGNGNAGTAPSMMPFAPAGLRIVPIDRDISQANIVLGHLGIARSDPDYYAVQVMNYILGGGGFASRLMRVVRDERGLTYGINSSFIGNKEPGQFEVEVQTKSASAGAVIDEIVRQMEQIRTGEVTDQELSDAKAYLTGSFPRRFETSRRIADFLAAARFYNLGDDYIQKYPDYIKSVTKEDVQRVAKKFLHPDRYVLVVVGNQKQVELPQPQPPQEVR